MEDNMENGLQTTIRKAKMGDLAAICQIYDDIHEQEEAGETTTGWLRAIYPTAETAEASIRKGDVQGKT